jgi:hypothetical protein
MAFLLKIGDLLWDIIVPIIFILSGAFFQGWALFIGGSIVSKVLNIILKPNLSNSFDDISLWGGFEEEVGFKMMYRTIILTAILCYISLSAIIFFEMKSDINSKDDNLPGIFMNMIVLNFVAPVTPVIGLYYICDFLKHFFTYYDIKFYFRYKFLGGLSLNAFVLANFIFPILSLFGFFVLKLYPTLAFDLWPWVFNL